MTEFLYFSEREGITPPRDVEKLSKDFWEGFVSLIRTLVKDGSLAEAFPYPCFESPLPIDSNRDSIQKRIQAEVPGFPWEPTEANKPEKDLIILDGVEFFGRYVSKVVDKAYHDYVRHNHLLRFDREQGFSQYRITINLFFRRSYHPFELNENGEIIRLGPPALNEILKVRVASGDYDLDTLINTAVEKFQNPDLQIRKEALEKLWDAWERLKSLWDSSNKRRSIQLLLTEAIDSEPLRKRIDREARELTEIGNKFRIRHSESDRVPIEKSIYVDYLFHRLFALILLLLKGKKEIK
jgi:hypothetical protein